MDNFTELPLLTKEELIENNDILINAPYKKCNLTCRSSCINDPIWLDPTCALGQSTGGTSGKSTFIWMNKYDAYLYIYTFITSFKKNGYRYGEKMMIFYPANSYFTNEYEKSNGFLSLLNVYFLSFDNVDKKKTAEFVDSINTNRPDFLIIFPFVLLQLCINIRKYNMKLKHYPRNINLSGEYLLNCSLRFCRETFVKSNIENTYGAVEFGEIAHQVKDDKNTFEVFNQFCYLENSGDKIVVTSFINDTFPIIRYVMEDIGKIVNKDGKQYIVDLIGKNTNQIIIGDAKFTSLDIDKLVEHVNIDNKIISIVIKYDDNTIDVNYIVYNTYTPANEEQIKDKTVEFIRRFFLRTKCSVHFIEDYEHNYLKKFKIIVKKDNTDNEPVGGFYKY
jgi:phenylacetate-coenzyme A ligase PaaK-like adenylate-forming protein